MKVIHLIRCKAILKIILSLNIMYFLIELIEFSIFDRRQTHNLYTVERYGPLVSSNVTVISHYFQLKKSKHSIVDYKKWVRNFFISVSSPLVIFTDKQSFIQELLELRTLLNQPTTLYVTDSIWNVLKENEGIRKLNYISNYKKEQLKLDREKQIHNSNLYALWNLKSFVTDKIAQENFYNSSAFIYSDSGAWRHQIIKDWPDNYQVMSLIEDLNDRVLLGQLDDEKKFIYKNCQFPDIDLIEGTFFMGSQKAVHHFKEEFWHIHDKKLQKGEFIGKDQILMNIILYFCVQ